MMEWPLFTLQCLHPPCKLSELRNNEVHDAVARSEVFYLMAGTLIIYH